MSRIGASRLLMVTLAFALQGCAAGRSFEQGRVAEERGEPQVAYDQYVRAATQHPGNGQIGAALSRVRPGAAAYWEAQGLAEMDAGRHDEAWRSFMKALDVQPDNASAAQLIRQLEAEHGTQIAEVRSQWMRNGERVLALAPFRESKPSRPVAPPVQLAAKPEPKQEEQLASARPLDRELARSIESERLDPPEPATKSGATEIEEPAAPPEEGRSSSMAESLEPEPPPEKSEESPRPPQAVPAPPAKPPGEFSRIMSLSKRDNAYPRQGPLIDGVDVTLRDTDGDGEVDLDLFFSKKRIRKIREITPGRSQLFTGRSGMVWRLTLLGVHHKSRTVRIGVKPA